MKRSTPLRRKTWMRRRRVTRRRSSRVYDEDYVTWVRQQACAADGISPCYGPIDPDHTGRRGYGQKANDFSCIPLCRRHHDQRASFTGPFKTWSRDHMRRWLDGATQWFNHMYAQTIRRTS